MSESKNIGRSLDMKRAEHALKAIQSLQDKSNGHYVSYVRALPANILQNGLGQSLATLLAAGSKSRQDDPHIMLYEQLQTWLCADRETAPYRSQSNLLKAITEGNEKDYLYAHTEALAYLNWLKKLAVAYLKDSDRREAS